MIDINRVLQNGDLLKFLRDHKQRGRERQANAVGTPYAGLSYADLNKFAYQVQSQTCLQTKMKI